jgi:hypothetical protein
MNGTIQVKRETKGDNAGTVMFMIGLMIFVACFCCSCATGGRIYLGYERHDTIGSTSAATDGNFLCGVMGYCREGESKKQ